LPRTMWGPFCSVPPVGRMIVVLPDSMRSRTSVQVSSSRKTVSGGPPVAARARTGDSTSPPTPAPTVTSAVATIAAQPGTRGRALTLPSVPSEVRSTVLRSAAEPGDDVGGDPLQDGKLGRSRRVDEELVDPGSSVTTHHVLERPHAGPGI